MLNFHAVDRDDASDGTGNVRHIARHGVTTEEVEQVLRSAAARDETSRSSARRVRFGWTTTGKFLMVAYKLKQGRTLTVVRPTTAYEVPPH